MKKKHENNPQRWEKKKKLEEKTLFSLCDAAMTKNNDEVEAKQTEE